jgi:predicted MFS family arabinose efflux permease
MTSIMRWLILIPAGPGALLGGWLGEHAGLRVALGFGGAGALLLGVWVWAASPLRHITRLPRLETTENPVHKGVQP